MMLSEKVIAAAQKRGKPGLYRDKSGNIWRVWRDRESKNDDWEWRASIVYPWIVDEETA